MTHLMRTLRLAALTVLTISTISAAPGRQASAQAIAHSASTAWYEDHWIDLSESWEGAGACNIGPSGSVCYDSETEMDQDLASTLGAASSTEQLAPASSCSSSLRLYDGTSYSGSVLNLYTRFTSINLSTYGFDNLTSSYRVGACAASFYSGASGSGTLYPGNTGANASSASMTAGWNNVVSSVYIS